VQQVIDGRLMRLGEEAEQLLEVAAVIGQEVPLELWQAVSRASHETIVEVVRRAVASHILVETRARTGLRFNHALVREAVYDRVVLPER
jgi:predicted ATPase